MSAPVQDPLAIILARMEVKIDQILMDIGDHEQRLRRLEERRWPLPVMAAVFSGLSLLATFIPMAVR